MYFSVWFLISGGSVSFPLLPSGSFLDPRPSSPKKPSAPGLEPICQEPPKGLHEHSRPGLCRAPHIAWAHFTLSQPGFTLGIRALYYKYNKESPKSHYTVIIVRSPETSVGTPRIVLVII